MLFGLKGWISPKCIFLEAFVEWGTLLLALDSTHSHSKPVLWSSVSFHFAPDDVRWEIIVFNEQSLARGSCTSPGNILSVSEYCKRGSRDNRLQARGLYMRLLKQTLSRDEKPRNADCKTVVPETECSVTSIKDGKPSIPGI